MMLRNLVLMLLLLLDPSTGLALAPAFNEGLGEPPLEVKRRMPAAPVAGFLEATHAG